MNNIRKRVTQHRIFVQQKQKDMTTYSDLVKQAVKAGFEDYCNTYNEYGLQGTIFTNTKKGSQFDGEVLDIFEDGTFTHYGQFKGQSLRFKFK